MKVIYIRTSTKEQEPINQLNDCKSMFEGEFELFEDKQSAWKDNIEREKFEKIRKEIQSHKVEDLYVWDLDRIFRNRKRLIEFFSFCKIYKCKIHSFRQQWLESLNNIQEPFNEIMFDLMLQIMGWLAEEESSKKSQRVRLAVRKKDGETTKSYKGNKWGRKKLSTQKRNIIIELSKQEPKLSMRTISTQSGVSVGVVHKILKEEQI